MATPELIAAALSGSEAAKAELAKGTTNDDEVVPTCDICGEQWEDGGEGEDWNGETGNHLSCEQDSPELARWVASNPEECTEDFDGYCRCDFTVPLPGCKPGCVGPNPCSETCDI
jgi:hypothetical protein